jgi:hypothetical protein
MYSNKPRLNMLALFALIALVLVARNNTLKTEIKDTVIAAAKNADEDSTDWGTADWGTAQEAMPTLEDRKPAMSIEDAQDFALNNLPYKKALTEYMKLLGTEVSAGNNEGILNYNRKELKNNSCFSELTYNFYQKIKELENQEIIKMKPIGNPNFSKLTQSAGSPGMPKEGWLWELALKYSNNNKNLALKILNVCGHDDLSNNIYIKDYMRMECPKKNSVFFLANSLPGVDIAETFKNRLGKTMHPKTGAENLSSKSYHFIASAYSSCLMVQNGFTEPTGLGLEMIAGTSASIYRGRRLCNMLLSPIAPDNKDSQGISKVKEHYAKLIDLNKNNSEMNRIERNKEVSYYLNMVDPSFYKNNCGNSDDIPGNKNVNLFGRTEFDLQKIFTKPCPPTIAPESCKRIKHRIKTWMLDFQWTQSQHIIGSRFAYNNCSPMSYQELHSKDCELIEKAKANPQIRPLVWVKRTEDTFKFSEPREKDPVQKPTDNPLLKPKSQSKPGLK